MIRAADRTRKIKYAIRDIAILAKQTEKEKKVIYLNVGDPNKFDFDTPGHVKKAAIDAIKGRHNYYAESQGVKEGIEAIVKHNNKLGIDTDEKSVMTTYGVTEGVSTCVAALLNSGENMLISRPSYPLYPAALNLFSCGMKFYTLDEENGWELDTRDIEKQIDIKTRAISIINPHNPTGGVYDKKMIKEVINLAGQHDLVILSDEIYSDLILEGKMHYTAAMSGEVPVITFNGLAKNFLAPGWRIGWLAITDREQKMTGVRDAIMQLGRARLCMTTPLQHAIKPALEKKKTHLKEVIRKMRKRRNIICRRINEIEGLSVVKPKAAFYAFPRIHAKIDDKDFVTGLLKEEGVATVFGSGFDMPGHFRIVYLPQEKLLNEACDRIERFMKTIR